MAQPANQEAVINKKKIFAKSPVEGDFSCVIIKNMNSLKLRSESGQIALPLILLISSIIIEIVIAGAFVSYYLSTSGLGARLSVRAQTAALSGIQDGLLQISENKEFGAVTQNYSVTVDSDSVSVTVSRTTIAQTNVYLYTITALGSAGTRQKKFVATASVDAVNGTLDLQSIQEVTAS